MTTSSYIDQQACGQCGLCVDLCPAHIPHRVESGANKCAVELRAGRLFACIACGHCMAACPNQAIHIEGLSYEEHIFDLPGTELNADAFFDLLASRRSIRVFKDQPVPRETLQRIVDAVATAPMGFPPHTVQVTVVQKRETIEQALPLIVQRFEDLEQWLANPIARFMIRRRTTPEEFNVLKNHVLPSMAYRLPDMKAGGPDTITRGAPVLLLFHAYREAEGHTDDTWIALTYGLLAAHALGLGATALSLVPPIVERTSELRALFQIPAENEVVASMVVGYPRIRFKRGIRRELAGVHWI